MHKTLTMLSLTAGNISSALWSIILGTLVARDRRTFCNLQLVPRTSCFVGYKRIRFAIILATRRLISLKYTSIWLGIVAHVQKFTNYDRVQTHLCRILCSHSRRLWILPPYMALCSLRDRYLNFEGRYLACFERTCCFRKFGIRLQDYTVLHPGNSIPNLQIYTAQPQKDVHYASVHTANSFVISGICNKQHMVLSKGAESKISSITNGNNRTVPKF
jgi:hypothetical protein